ncbi:tRNA (cytidine(56)-2'-O)-methyltransferase [Candidatus Bathyarchaeota archaeon]|nr:tRNA (cytidine(56)-2'-O)-methyltransferase [Candidatus Bathyarchaeota archaeon]
MMKMIKPKVYVLRLGHRAERDKRATMHIFLTARALSASAVIYSGQKDSDLEKRIQAVVDKWGGPFKVRYQKNWKKVIENWKKKGVTCHLTMYGINIDDCLDKIPKNKDVLVIVGSQKVPKNVFQLADLNIAITNQPHSEIAALAVFLDRLFQGKELKRKFKRAKIRVIPQERGKKVNS